MARRNPGISPILSARGYAARVLWPKYTPSGGVNSGSEVPLPPSNTLQSNMSNLVTHNNPFKPITQDGPGRIAVVSKRGKTLYMTPNQIMKMGSRMLQAGEVERALGARSNPFGRYYGEMYDQDSGSSVSAGQAQAEHSAASSHHQYVRTPTMPSAMSQVMGPMRRNPFGLYEELEPGIVFTPDYSDSALDNPSRHRSQMSGAQRAKKELAKGRRSFVAKHGSLDAPRESRFDRGYTDFEGRKLRPVMGRREQEREFQAGLEWAFAPLSNPSRHRSQMSGSQRATAAKKRSGRHIASSQRRMADITRQAEYEAALEGADNMYNNPRTFAGAKSKSARAAAALKKSQAKAIARSEAAIGARFVSKAQAMNARAAERDVQRGYYGAVRSGQLPQHARISDYLANPKGAGANDASVKRASGATKLQMRSQILAKLDSGMSHNDVRTEMGLSYPIYMMVLRSHWTK